jgi:integrase
MKGSQAIDRMRQVIRLQHKSLATEDCYVFWLRRYIAALHTIPAELSSEKKLERFLTHLALHDNVAASTQNQAFNAVVFFYKAVLSQPLGNVDALRAKRPVHQRHAPSLAETQLLLQAIRNVGGYPTNLVARLLYGCGLRVSEPLNLRIKDINLEQSSLCIRGAKGGHDRTFPLPGCLMPELKHQIQVARLVWQLDYQNRTPLMLPHRLARKYPEYQFSWRWAWLFPAHLPCRDPRTDTLVRYRMHEGHVQRAVKYARRRLGISVLPHELRHHSECRIIPGKSQQASDSWFLVPQLSFPTRNNPGVLFLQLRNGVKRKGHSCSIYTIHQEFNGTVCDMAL